MRVRAACLVSAVAFTLVASSARADETVWNPFLFNVFCSTCGPQTPLSLEQVDAVQVLIGGQLGPAIPLAPPFDSDIELPGGGGNGPTKPAFPVLPAAALVGGQGNSNGASATGGSSGAGPHHDNNGGSDNNGASKNGESEHDTDGLEYGVNVGEDSTADETVVTFTSDNVPKDVASDTSGAGGGGGEGGQTLVPEPTTLLLFGSGLALVSAGMRKRRGAPDAR